MLYNDLLFFIVKKMNKVAKVTIFFWIMKIIATTLGETAGDFISMSLGLGYYIGFAITFAILAILLFFQIQSDRYRPVFYWAAIIATTTAGTEVSDLMDRSLGLGYALGSLILVACLLTVLSIWYYRDRDLSVYPIARKDAETTYWLAVVFSNSLGTAFGDFLTSNLGLSYIQGALVTASVIGVVIALHYVTKLSDILLFWLAFIFTRPFGATFGDFLTKPVKSGGLSLPREYASAIAFILLAVVLFLDVRREKKVRHPIE
ncbi:MAG: COG4705 family protein [Hassallia sp.]